MAAPVFPSLLVAAVVLRGLAVAQTTDDGGPFEPNLYFNLTTSVVDPINIFEPANLPSSSSSPDSEILPTNEWVTTFDESFTYMEGMAGLGASHRTGAVNLTSGNVSLTSYLPWSSVYVYGKPVSQNANPVWRIDDTTSLQDLDTPPSGMFGKATNMRWGGHKLYLYWDQGKNATVDSIVYTMAMKTQA